MSIEELIGRVFYDRNHAHIEHWKTGSYAQHQALGDFYGGAIDILDRFIEAYQGLSGVIGEVKDYKPEGKPAVLKCLSDNAKWIATNREKICEDVEALENILDELVGLYLTTIYKLKHLS